MNNAQNAIVRTADQVAREQRNVRSQQARQADRKAAAPRKEHKPAEKRGFWQWVFEGDK